MKTRAIIQARMGSTRLRGKSLMPVAGIPLLVRVIETVRGLGFDEVVVATTTLPEDDPIVSVASDCGVLVTRGSALNVLERFNDACADMSESDSIVRFTADNPFNHYRITTELYNLHITEDNDYTHIDGLSHIVAEFVKVRALREAGTSNRLDNFDREHVTPFFRKRKELFKVASLPPDFLGLRHDLDKFLTIDNSEDMVRAESMINDLSLGKGGLYTFEQIYDWLDSHALGIRRNRTSPKVEVMLDGVPVGEDYPTYIIAEIGQNHNGDMKLAKKLIDMAVRCGASAVKFQKRDIASELTKEAYNRPYDNPNSFGITYGEHRRFLELSESQHLELKEYAQAAGITYFCTPCDIPSIEVMQRIGCPFYKVASRDLTNIPLLERLSETGKPIIISTGMADLTEIEEAIAALKGNPNNVIIMQCTSEYPCKLENVNMRAIETLRKKFGHLVGLSDHTSGIVVSTGATLMGAKVIEKHITLDRTMKGTDQPGSLEESGLRKLIQYIRALEIALGDGEKIINPVTDQAKAKLARSLTSAVMISKGQILTEDMICLKSPGTGLKWSQRDKIVGKVASRDIEVDVTLSEDDFYESN